MSKRRKILYNDSSKDDGFTKIIDLTDEIKNEPEHQFSTRYPPQIPTNQSNPRSPSPSLSGSLLSNYDTLPPSSSQPSGSRAKKRAWTKEEDEALIDSIITECTGRWSAICSRNELLVQRGPSMASQRFKNSIKHKLLSGENSNSSR